MTNLCVIWSGFWSCPVEWIPCHIVHTWMACILYAVASGAYGFQNQRTLYHNIHTERDKVGSESTFIQYASHESIRALIIGHWSPLVRQELTDRSKILLVMLSNAIAAKFLKCSTWQLCDEFVRAVQSNDQHKLNFCQSLHFTYKRKQHWPLSMCVSIVFNKSLPGKVFHLCACASVSWGHQSWQSRVHRPRTGTVFLQCALWCEFWDCRICWTACHSTHIGTPCHLLVGMKNWHWLLHH